MKIVALGGYGEMGAAAVADLVKTCKDCEIVIAGRDAAKAKRYATSFKKKNVKGTGVDVENHDALVRLLKGADVVMNSVVYRMNLHVMRAALEAGCGYVDLGGLFHMTKKQLKLHPAFEKKGVLAILGCGSTPGITNVMAAYGSRDLDRIDDIRVTFATYSNNTYKNHFILPYSFYTLVDEFTSKPAVFENGKMKFVEPVTGEHEFCFPKPIGKVTGFYTLHSEIATFPKSFRSKGLRNCSFRATFDKDFVHDMKLFIEAGMASRKPVNIGGCMVKPIDVAVKGMVRLLPKDRVNDLEYVRVELDGKKNGKNKTITVDCVTKSAGGVPAGTRDTAIPLSIAAQMVARKKINAEGVLPPESCINPEEFFQELKKRDIRIIKTISN
jgi:saccharopine dehydrogenase (NAD+, L-lysine-forming)